MRLLNRLHQWDVLRANKAPFAWGVETRVPFLDKAFLDLVMNTDPADKMVCFGWTSSVPLLVFCSSSYFKQTHCILGPCVNYDYLRRFE